MTPHIVHGVDSIAARHGGPTRAIRDLVEALARAGARVTLLTGDAADAPDLLRPDPALVTTLARPGWRGLAGAFAARLPAGIDLVHDHGLWKPWNLAADTAAGRAGVPLVVSPHGMLAPWALAWRRQRKALAWGLYQRRLLAGAAALLATAPAEAADIAARLPGARIAVLPNGVALPDAVPSLGERACHVLFLGRLHPVKNLPGLLAAWALVAPRFPQWRLRLVGPEEAGHRALLISEAARLGIGASVDIAEAIADSEKARAFAGASLFVLPSFTENFGVVAAEALAAGLPVIASTGTPWAALPAAGAGWHVAPDPESLAAALAEAMALTPATRAAMGARGAALAAREFGWTPIADRLLALYRWLLAGQPADARPEALHG